jgi:hypothetical protein
MLKMVESIWCARVVPTIDRATNAWRSSRRVRQHSLRYIAAHRCCLAGRAQMSDNVDSSRRAVECRPSTLPPVHSGTAVACAKVAYDVPVLAVVIRRDYGRFRTMSTRLVEACGAVSTIDLAARARWCRLRKRQRCLRCTSTRRCCLVGLAQMLDKVDPLRCATRCRPSISPPVLGGTAVVCANVAYDVPVLAVVIRPDERRCRTMSTRSRSGAQCSVDHQSRRRCAQVPWND